MPEPSGAFEQGIKEFEAGTDPFVDRAFFQLTTFEERERWHGWQYASGRKQYLRSATAVNSKPVNESSEEHQNKRNHMDQLIRNTQPKQQVTDELILSSDTCWQCGKAKKPGEWCTRCENGGRLS